MRWPPHCFSALCIGAWIAFLGLNGGDLKFKLALVELFSLSLVLSTEFALAASAKAPDFGSDVNSGVVVLFHGTAYLKSLECK